MVCGMQQAVVAALSLSSDRASHTPNWQPSDSEEETDGGCHTQVCCRAVTSTEREKATQPVDGYESHDTQHITGCTLHHSCSHIVTPSHAECW